MTIIGNGKRYAEYQYQTEKDFEEDVITSSKILFGKSTIYINAKKKIDSKSLGSTVPDGFFFDFADSVDPQFYIVEAELSKHSFYNHIFPQVTKFFAFFKNTKLQKSLVDKIFSIINTDDGLKNEFKRHLGQVEIYKFLSDIIESSQNILLIADGPISELPEIMDTYTDTWGKMVKYLEIRKYVYASDTVYTINPDYEILQYEDIEGKGTEAEDEVPRYSESYHLEGVNQSVVEIYGHIKSIAAGIDDSLVFNPQKYYISIRTDKNIAFIQVRNKKIRFIAMMPQSEAQACVKHHAVVTLSDPVQRFYNGPCAAIDINHLEHMDEIELLIQRVIKHNKST